MNHTPANKKALIAGGGIAGPVTAMALQRAGIHSRTRRIIDPAAPEPCYTDLRDLRLSAFGIIGGPANSPLARGDRRPERWRASDAEPR
jgi:hypothetical protein